MAAGAKTIAYGQYRVPPASETVKFTVGQPAPSLLPLDALREAASAKFAETDPLYLQYGQIPGYPEFRESLAKFLAKHLGKEVDAEDLFVTNGVTGALTLISSLYLRAGDLVVVGEPTYFLALDTFRDFGLKTVSFPVDTHGLDVDALEEKLKGDPSFRPKALYCIPVYHNPTGYTMSTERREKLAALADEYDFLVLADEVYQLLGFDDSGNPPPPPMYYFDKGKGNIVSIGSFSKILAPALRLGWLQTKAPVRETLAKSGQLDSSGGINPVISGIVHQTIDSGAQDKHLEAVKLELGGRSKTLAKALHEHLPEGCAFEEPEGGYFLWIQLPEGMDGEALAKYAADNHKVIVLPGTRFGATLTRYIRLSCSYYPAEDLATGAERLGAAIRAFASQ